MYAGDKRGRSVGREFAAFVLSDPCSGLAGPEKETRDCFWIVIVSFYDRGRGETELLRRVDKSKGCLFKFTG